MALPSVVTVSSLTFVLAAGGAYVAIAAASADTSATTAHQVVHSSVASPYKPITVPQHSSTVHHVRPVVPDVLIEIYNNNGVTGQAEQAAATLQGAGWNVSATDNWYGNIPGDTVYYPPALHDDAIRLAKVLHITRLHTAVAPMKFDRLTVILTAS